MRSLEEELAGLSKSREFTIKENRRLQDDLATMTAENQVILFLSFKDFSGLLEVACCEIQNIL